MPRLSITVQDFDAQDIELVEKYKSKPLLIIIYNNKCLGCTGRAIPLAFDLQQRNSGLQVIGIHTSFSERKTTKAEILSIFTKAELPFPIYLDENRRVYDQFDAEGTPQWLIISGDGEVYRSIFGSQTRAQNRLSYAIEELLSSTS